MKTLKDICLLHVIAAGFFIIFSASESFPVTAEVSPATVAVDSLYHGSRITVTGEAEAGDDIIIKFSSPPKKMHLRKKGKQGGVLWMNVGELEFDPVSDVYIVYATKDITAILSTDQQDTYALGYDAFKRRVEVSPAANEAEKEKWIDEFLKFKMKNNTYIVSAGDIETEITGEKETYKISVDWPYQAPPQAYTVTVYAVRNNIVQSHYETPLNVEKVGALNFISGMAFNKASMYGIVSILIAIAAGFLVSAIFKGGGGSH